ncbi:uncharacterized protein PAE49_016372 [Odontesthes bonariensis]
MRRAGQESHSKDTLPAGASSDPLSRFHGDGVRYKAKLIGMDPLPDAQGQKMCLNSMMKLKGFEAAARKQGRHKLRFWLKISSSGLKIVDERTGVVLHDHDRSRISSLTKDESDPRALAYIYQKEDTYVLFYIKTANQADPVLLDIKEVCQRVEQETPKGPAETQGSSSNELMEVFSTQLEEPISPTESSCTSQPEPAQQTFSTTQMLSMFPVQPVGGSPYFSPTYSPTTMPWGQQGPQGNQWGGQWPTMPGSTPAWAPPGTTENPAAGQPQAHTIVNPQPGFMVGGSTIVCPAAPSPIYGYPTPLNSAHTHTGTTGALGSPSLDNNLLL